MGWHPDPSGRFEFRYFNGQRWTSDVASDGRRLVDGGTPESPRPGRGLAVASLVIALCSVATAWVPFLFVLAAGGAVVAFVFGLRARRWLAGANGTGLATAGLVLAPIALALCSVGVVLTTLVLREVDRYLSPGRHELVADLPCTVSDGVARLTGSISNLEAGARDYRITVEALENDRVVERVRVTVEDVGPGSTEAWLAEMPVGGADAVTCRVREVRGPSPFGVEP